jgi:glycosyltransferase involved in cell wall biosynthesis
MRELLGFTENEFVIAPSGRLDPFKNRDVLLEIFARCLQQHSSMRFLVVSDGPEKERLEYCCNRGNVRRKL